MIHHPNKHRRSIRLHGYNYSSPGLYFVTICTYQRQLLFGAVVNGVMRLNDFGCIVATEWAKSADIRREIECDEWVVMPNHVHGIIRIVADGDVDGFDNATTVDAMDTTDNAMAVDATDMTNNAMAVDVMDMTDNAMAVDATDMTDNVGATGRSTGLSAHRQRRSRSFPHRRQ